MNTTNLHMIRVKYFGPTNVRGSRVKLTSERFGTSKTVPYGYEFNNACDIGVDWLEKNGFEVVGSGEMKYGYIVATKTFKEL